MLTLIYKCLLQLSKEPTSLFNNDVEGKAEQNSLLYVPLNRDSGHSLLENSSSWLVNRLEISIRASIPYKFNIDEI